MLGPQLALFVEFLFEILCVSPTPTRIVCRISFRNSLCWAPVYAFYLLHKMVQVIYFSFSILSKNTVLHLSSYLRVQIDHH